MNSAGDVLRLAARGVVRNRRRTLVTGAMIALGVAAVLFSRGFIASLQVMMTDSLIDVRYGALEVERLGYHASSELAPLDLDLPAEGPLRAAIASARGVAAVSARLRFVGVATRGDASLVVAGAGVEPGLEARVCPHGPAARTVSGEPGGERYQLVAGEGLGRPDGVVLGVDLAAALAARPGDVVTVMAQTRSGSLDAVDLVVVGLYRWDQPEDNRRGLVVPLPIAQRLLHMPGRASTLAIRVVDREHIDETARALAPVVGAASPAVELLYWRDLGPYLRDVMSLQDRVLQIVLAIVFAIMVTGVANTMLMSVFERTREIGTLLCLGMRRRQILVLILTEALLLAALASAAGTLLGIGIVTLTHRIGIPFVVPAVGMVIDRPLVDLAYAGIATAAALTAALAAALYPAWRAARLSPIDAARAV